MNKLKIFSIALLAFGATTQAQDLEQAKKAIDAEQYDNAKKILKALVASSPDSGKNFFILGNVYLTQRAQDSATIYFQKGLTAKTEPHFNYIGLGQIDLENGNASAATANFTKATENTRKKDFEENLYIGRAYMNPVKPDFKKAIEYINKAKAVQPMNAQVQLSLGDALIGDKNTNEAYSAYRNAYDADKSVLRAKLQLGVLTKNSRAFNEANAEFDAILKINPNYGPAYREKAETYRLMAIESKKDEAKYAENNKKAMELYEKYMSMTDYSLDSRIRHADFLILTKDYKALEAEATAMQKMDKVNPRILRYLGYSAYENGNPDAAIKALNDFIAKDPTKVIGRDYLYLGLAKTKKALTTTTAADGKATGTVDKTLFDAGVADLKKGVQLDPAMANELNDFGMKFYELKLYNEAAAIYEAATTNPNEANYLYDNFYLGYALYFANVYKDGKTEKVDPVALKKASDAFTIVYTQRPTQQDAYLYKARVNGLLEDDASKTETMKAYEEYIKAIMAKGDAETSKPANKTKLVEAYNNIGIYYAKLDKVKAKENFDKALAIDPADETAISYLKALK